MRQRDLVSYDSLLVVNRGNVIVDCSASIALGILVHDTPFQLIIDMHFRYGSGSNVLHGIVSSKSHDQKI